MKKIFLLLISLFVLVGCEQNNLRDTIYGAWQINNEPRIITFHDNTFNIERLYNIIERNGIYNVQNNNTIVLKYNSKEHFMYYIKNIYGYDREAILIKNLYNDNKIDTLYRIQIIN